MTTDVPAEHELPEDVDRWPTDPYQLLRVRPESSRRDLKRSYTRLIRKFKPEHFPDQFRRLREAFDQVDRQLAFFEQYQIQVRVDDNASNDSHEPSSSVSSDTSHSNDDGQKLASNSQPLQSNRDERGSQSDAPLKVQSESAENRRQPGQIDNTDQIWQQVLDGNDPATVYSRLVETILQGRGSETEFARLYWLLSFRPDLNTGKAPCEWLIEGIRRHGCRSRLPNMLAAEIRRSGGDGQSILTAELFDTKFPFADIVGLAELRWHAARRLERFDVIQNDIKRLETQFFEDPEEWQRLLYTAIRQLVFLDTIPAPQLLNLVCKKIQQTPATVSSNWLWDSFDSIMTLHGIWMQRKNSPIGYDVTLHGIDLSGQPKSTDISRTVNARTTHGMLLDLIRNSWERSALQVRTELLFACAELTTYPLTSLNELAVIVQLSRPVAYRLLELLREQRDEFVDMEGYKLTQAAQRRIFEFVVHELWKSHAWEASVLRFCLNEAVSPNDVADMIEECRSQLPESCLTIAQAIRSDLAIACIVEAQRLLW